MNVILIRIKQNNLTRKRMAHLFADAFYDDPLYVYIFPDDKTRLEALEVFFKMYLDVLGKYGELVTNSEDMTAVAYIYYEERFKSKSLYYKDLFLASLRLTDFLRYVKVRDVYRMLKTVHHLSSEWIHHNVEGNYIHLDLLAVQREYRGLGKAKALVDYAIQEAKLRNLPLTLETQNAKNINLYRHFEFETVKEISYENMVQYCMIRK
ncbi:GNAT family N-acetyltransferase [Niameybacter massiliensis]|uniref:GNAT family N-acetyltransferase n=2 Tax=Lachnospirales TaxID=3085636 RepID=A0AA42DP33_9FIRM|nr:GNAT family N-acetyltransferase [Holtiella tumoricola]